jgi:hypothetical protein
MNTIHKRLVRVTLDIECYNDLDLDIDWAHVLDLQDDESVYYNIKEVGDLD